MNVTYTRLLCSLGLALSAAVSSVQAQEKVLKLYNWADYFAEDTLSRFTAETGIKVIYDVMDGSETLEAKMMTGGSGYDLIFPGDTVGERLMAAISNFTGYPTSNAKARPSVDPMMRNNPDIYLDPAAFEKLIPGKDISQADMRARMRAWAKFKTAPVN